MHRTDGDSHVANQFSETPPGTQVTDNWLNDVQENICEAIEEAGITLVKDDFFQLRDAIPILARAALLALTGASDTAPVFDQLNAATGSYKLLWRIKLNATPVYARVLLSDGGLVFTTNAHWNGSNWAVDSAGSPSVRLQLARAGGVKIYELVAGTSSPFSDATFAAGLITEMSLANGSFGVSQANGTPGVTGQAFGTGVGISGIASTGNGGIGTQGTAGVGVSSTGVKGLAANANNLAGVYGSSTHADAHGGYFSTSTGTAASVAAVYGDSSASGGYAVVANGDPSSPVKSALRVVPQDTEPSGPNQIGDLYVKTGDSKLYICTVAGTPGTWVVVGAQVT